MKTINQLQEERRKQGMTYDELAKKSGVSKSTITNIFCGYVQFPRVDTMQAIERALGLNDEWTAEERAAGVTDTVSIPITAIEDEMLTLFREIREKHGEEAQKAIITVLEKML